MIIADEVEWTDAAASRPRRLARRPIERWRAMGEPRHRALPGAHSARFARPAARIFASWIAQSQRHRREARIKRVSKVAMLRYARARFRRRDVRPDTARTAFPTSCTSAVLGSGNCGWKYSTRVQVESDSSFILIPAAWFRPARSPPIHMLTCAPSRTIRLSCIRQGAEDGRELAYVRDVH